MHTYKTYKDMEKGNEFKAKGTRADNGRTITGYPFRLHGCWYIMPPDAEDLHTIYRLTDKPIKL